MKINDSLLSLTKKYDRPIPRYTSYPTVPYWQNNFESKEWQIRFTQNFEKENSENGISLYIHLPFCESLCTYCGCNKKITNNHTVEDEYINAIRKEWTLYRNMMHSVPIIREIHLGGGTPTFFSPENLERLISIILSSASLHPQYEMSIEGHPNNTTYGHLQTLYNIGFRRISYGVQDIDNKVQQIINRIQPIDNVRRATDMARDVGFTSVNFDLIYGLPLQTEESITQTIIQTINLSPDRIAFYSYAHVPGVSRAQRLFDETDLPKASEKITMYLKAKELFTENGYTDIGMDHFSLPGDDLFKAWSNGKLHRNFMGYTVQSTNLLLGLGVSSISDASYAFAQNNKSLHAYYDTLQAQKIPVTKGYFLTKEDERFRRYILDIGCKGITFFHKEDIDILNQYSFPMLESLEEDGLVQWNEKGIMLTPTGRFFIRNVCHAFDIKMLSQKAEKSLQFSRAV